MPIIQTGKVKFSIELSSTGHFVITEDKMLLANGHIQVHNVKPTDDSASPATNTEILELSKEDIYQEFRVRGYDYGAQFQSLQTCQAEGN